MLVELSIRDFAIIDTLRVTFTSGFSVFSGETGAGKSIIIDAIELILGDRASTDGIREGKVEASVEALFDITDRDDIKEKLTNSGLNSSDELVIRRVVARSGKNKVYINGGLSTLTTLADISADLIDICGQSEHQSLTHASTHIDSLDNFGGMGCLRTSFAKAYEEMTTLSAELSRIKSLVEEAARDRELKGFQLKEIHDACLEAKEEDQLASERERLRNSERLRSETLTAENILYSNEGAIIEKLGTLVNSLKEISIFDEKLSVPKESLEEALFALEDGASFLRDYASNVDDDPERLVEVEDRIEIINELKRKYGGEISQIIDRADLLEKELSDIEGYDERVATLEATFIGTRESALKIARELNGERIKAAKILKSVIEGELNDLGMEGSVFEIEVTEVKETDGSLKLSENGANSVRFLISTNPGEGIKPLETVASGGELSRVMLAMKKSTTHGRVGTLIFDEIDSNVGGSMGKRIAEKLKEVSTGSQVFCITHLPQVAAMADNHFFISKGKGQDNRTVTSAIELNKDERVGEITRMLGGTSDAASAVKHAKELLRSATHKGE